MNNSGNFAIAWTHGFGDNDICAQFFLSDGSKIDSNVQVNNFDSKSELRGHPSIEMNDDGNCVISWVDQCETKNFSLAYGNAQLKPQGANQINYIRCYSQKGEVISEPYIISEGFYSRGGLCASFRNNRIYNTWRHFSGICACVLEFANTTSICDSRLIEVSDKSLLRQNSPNPFSSFTRISYSLAKADHASLIVYGLLGNKIITLTDAWLQSGCYTVVYDGYQLPNGTYFFQLKVGNSVVETKKMVLLK